MESNNDRDTNEHSSGIVGSIVSFVVAQVLCFSAAAIGGAFTGASVRTWYPELSKPTWSPPDWVFGPVWTILYAMMGISVWLIWRSRGWSGAPLALGLFAIQLVLNAMWSVIFFGAQNPGLAFAEIVCLWLAIVATVIAFWRHSRLAASLLVPYLAWSTFAAVLNYTIWQLN